MSDNPYQPYQPPQQPNQQPNQQQPYQGGYQPGQYQSPYQQDYQQQQQYQGGYQPGQYQPGYAFQQQLGNKTQLLGLDANVAGLLCYLPFMAINLISSIAFVVTEPKSNYFVRFHATQSLLLTVGGTILGIVVGIGSVLLIPLMAMMGKAGGAIAGLGFLLIFGFIGIFSLTILILHIMGMYKAYNNETWEMPIVGKYARQFCQKN